VANEESGSGTGFRSHIHELGERSKTIIITLLVTTIFFMFFPANPLDLLNPDSWTTGFYRPMVSLLLEQVRNYAAPSGLEIISLQIGDPLEVYVFASLLLGFVLSSPIIGYEIFKFIDPALLPEERSSIYPFILAFTGCFVFGAAFGYLYLARFIGVTMIIFSSFVGAQPVITAYDFYSMIFTTILFTGFGFTLPVIFVLLVKLGIIETSILTENRKIIYIALFALTALITADGGPLADLALCVPVILLTEISVVIAKSIEKNRKKARLESGVVTLGICRYCGSKFRGAEVFCRKCGRSRS